MHKVTTNNIFKSFLKYVSLNILGMIGLSCYILADTFFISKGIGTNGITALNLAIPIYSIINGVGLMIGIGGATRYAILQAQDKSKEASKNYSQAIVIGMIGGLGLLLCGLFFSDNLAELLGADHETFLMTSIYLKTILCFAPLFILNNVISSFIRNDGAPKLSMIAMLIGSFSNIVLDYIFVFPLNMGMFGAALATGAAPSISLLILLSHFVKGQNKMHFIVLKLRFSYIKDILTLGMSAFITELSSGIVIIVFNIIILSIAGNIGVAAYGIVVNLALVVASIFTGIAQGIQPLISTNYGFGNQLNIKQILRYALIFSILVSTIIYTFTISFSKQIIYVFNSDNNTVLEQIASQGLELYFIAFLFVGINIILASYFSSVELPLQSFIVSILRGCVAIIPIVIVLAKLFGMTGVWIAYPISEFITALIATVFLCNRKKRPIT